MEPQKIEINGYQLLIKLMDASYIMCEDEVSQNIKVDVECRPISPCWPKPIFRPTIENFWQPPMSARSWYGIIDWARQNNRDRVIARVMLDGEPMSYYPTESFWIRTGFNPKGPVRSFV
jgi:hypothetical protein